MNIIIIIILLFHHNYKDLFSSTVPQQFVFKSPLLQSNAAGQKATNSRQKRKVQCSSYVTQSNVKKAKGESTQLPSEPVPDPGTFDFYLAFS